MKLYKSITDTCPFAVTTFTYLCWELSILPLLLEPVSDGSMSKLFTYLLENQFKSLQFSVKKSLTNCTIKSRYISKFLIQNSHW